MMHESYEKLYNTDVKHIEANLESFIHKKEELMRSRKSQQEK